MTATTAAHTSLTITADTDPAELVNRHVLFTIAGAHGPITLSGTFKTLKHMDFGNGVTGVGGTFVSDDRPKPGDTGHTGMFVPGGTTVFLPR